MHLWRLKVRMDHVSQGAKSSRILLIHLICLFELDIQGESGTPASTTSNNQTSRNKPMRNYSASSSQNTNDNFKSADFPELDQKTAGMSILLK